MSDSEEISRAATPPADDRDTPPPPAANPDLDMDNSDASAVSDHDESDLSEVDEAEFADFDPTTVALDDRPAVDIDEDIARTLKAGKRKRDKDAPPEGAKKPREAKRDKPKKNKRPAAAATAGAATKTKARRESDEGVDEGNEIEGKRKPKSARIEGERRERDRVKERKAKSADEVAAAEDEANLTPAARRRNALDRAMDAALKNPNKRRRKKDEVDLEEAFDEEIAALKIRMERACEADNTARVNGEPAIHKLKMLPEVMAMLNRNTSLHSIVDPDTNFLQSVKFFLEPLGDGSLPAYNIQRDLFAALTKLPIEKEALLSSGIGKVVLYYTKSKRAEIGIKRTAERLLGEWSRPILKRSDDYKKRKVETRDFDSNSLAYRPSATQSLSQASQRPTTGLSQRELERERILAPAVVDSGRARMVTTNTSYTIAPRSNFDASRGVDPATRPIGAGGMDAFRRMTMKQGRKKT